MKLRSKPESPEYKNTEESDILNTHIYDEMKTSDLITLLNSYPTTSQIRIGGDCDTQYIEIYWTVKESEESFNKRKEAYLERLNEYNEWYSENKEEIEAELLRQKNKKNQKLEKQMEYHLKELEKIKKNQIH